MKKRIKYFLYSFLLLSPCYSNAQQNKVDSLLNILRTSKADTIKINTYNELFLQYEFSDDIKAKHYLDEALDLCKKTDYKKGFAASYIYAGYFAEDKSNFDEALKNYIASLNICEAINDKKGIAGAYNEIGNIYDFQGNYPEALKNYFASLKMMEAIGNKIGEAAAYNNIGVVYRHQGNYGGALKNYQISLEIRKAIGDKKDIGDSYENLGVIYGQQGNYPEALKNYAICLKIWEVVNDKRAIASCYSDMGVVYYDQAVHEKDETLRAGLFEQALKEHLVSLKIKEEVGDKAGIANSCNNIGGILIREKKYKEAEQYIIRAKDLAKETGHKLYLKGAYHSLTELDSAKGDFKGAYENHKLYILYHDSLDNEETRKKTIQSQMTYDFEKKEAVAAAEHKKELENQQVFADEKSRKQHLVLLLVSCFLILVLFFSGFIFRLLSITRKQKRIIEKQKNLVEQQKQEVEQQKLLVEEKQKEVIDSINYARRIQQSQLPTEKYIEKNLKRLMKG